MCPDKQKELKLKYAHLFGTERTPFNCWGFETEEGWDTLIENLLAELSEYGQSNNTEIRVLQIKEKFGILCVWPGQLDEEHRNNIWQILTKYTELSKKTCEATGQPGQICKKGYWLKTLCIDKARELGYDFIS